MMDVQREYFRAGHNVLQRELVPASCRLFQPQHVSFSSNGAPPPRQGWTSAFCRTRGPLSPPRVSTQPTLLEPAEPHCALGPYASSNVETVVARCLGVLALGRRGVRYARLFNGLSTLLGVWARGRNRAPSIARCAPSTGGVMFLRKFTLFLYFF